ncbi:MAG: TonB-dependent receptor [Erythrobacter sp.]|uniref:TonB-dependent receptor n=1 Tax=Erythrobacter sp. TaxID=1042 RepID=UPI002613B900|nr:TonB-dependent receptor [Erythrobacter sp.]MDJ0978137.1 TonB-dependent receptor [Erythrobacter sp.]
MVKSFNRKSKLLGASALVLAFGGVLATPATAQEVGAEEASEEDNVIIVTARRQAEPLAEVPASIDVFSAEEIEQQGIFDFGDLALRSPNVTIFEGFNNPADTVVTIRGVPGRAGIYVDDVFVGNAGGINTLLVDIERVEIVRGPQTTLFGRDALSGAINTVTRKPGDEFEGSFLARYGAYDLTQLGGSLSGPITEGVSAKVAGGYRTQDSFDEVRGRGDDFNVIDEFMVVGQLKFDVTDNFTALFNVDYLENEQVTGLSDVSRDIPNDPNAAIFRIGANDGDPFDRVLPGRDVLPILNREVVSGYARLEWELGDFELRSISAVRDTKTELTRDGDNSQFDIISGFRPSDDNQFTQELTLFYDNGSNFSAQLGTYFFDSENSFADSNDIGADFPFPPPIPNPILTEQQAAGIDASIPGANVTQTLAPFAPGGLFGILTPGRYSSDPVLQQVLMLPIPPLPDGGNQTTFSDTELQSLAFYGQGTWNPIERLELSAGLRYTRETNQASLTTTADGLTALLLFGDPTGNFSVGPVESEEAVDNIWTPSFSAKFDVTDTVRVYASYAEGFRSGGFNTAPVGPTETTFDESRRFEPEEIQAYEIGLKWRAPGGRAAINAAAFMQDYNNFQRGFTIIDNVGNRVSLTENTSASVEGFEIDGFIEPIDGFTLSAAYGYQESTYDDYPGAAINIAGFGTVLADLTGEQLPNVPKHTLNIVGAYELDLSSDWSLRFGGDAQYRSSYRNRDAFTGTQTVIDSQNNEVEAEVDPESFVDATTIFNANVAFTNEQLGLTVTGRVFNITDEVFSTGVDVNVFSGVVSQSLSAPRTWTIEVLKRF